MMAGRAGMSIIRVTLDAVTLRLDRQRVAAGILELDYIRGRGEATLLRRCRQRVIGRCAGYGMNAFFFFHSLTVNCPWRDADRESIAQSALCKEGRQYDSHPYHSKYRHDPTQHQPNRQQCNTGARGETERSNDDGGACGHYLDVSCK